MGSTDAEGLTRPRESI